MVTGTEESSGRAIGPAESPVDLDGVEADAALPLAKQSAGRRGLHDRLHRA